MAFGLSIGWYVVWLMVTLVGFIGTHIFIVTGKRKNTEKIGLVCLIVILGSIIIMLFGSYGDFMNSIQEEKTEGIRLVETRMNELQEKGSVENGEIEFNTDGYLQGNVGGMDVFVGGSKYHVKVDKKEKKVIEVQKIGDVVN